MTGDPADERNSLPASDSGLLRANDWGPTGMWILCAVLVLLGVLSLIHWTSKEDISGVVTAFGYLFFALFCGRGALVGLLTQKSGITVRTVFRTYRWNWDEIEDFELRGTVYTPSLQVRLRNGKTKGVVGLAARTTGEKARAKRIFDELNQRLSLEHAASARGE